MKRLIVKIKQALKVELQKAVDFVELKLSNPSNDGSVSKVRWQRAQAFEAAWWRGWFDEHKGNDDDWLGFVLDSFSINNLSVFDGKVLVDLGGGPVGILTKLEGGRKICVDPNPIPSVNSDIERIFSPAEEIPLGDCVADVVFMYNLLQHVQSPRKCLEEAFRVMKPNGKIYINEQLYLPVDIGHPHTLKEDLFKSWCIANELVIRRWEVRVNESYAGKNRPGEAILIAELERPS